MSVRAVDTLRYADQLKNGGFTQEQAEIQAKAQAEVIKILLDEQIATKSDIESLKGDFKSLEARLEVKIENIIPKMTVRMGGIVAVGIAVLLALMKILKI